MKGIAEGIQVHGSSYVPLLLGQQVGMEQSAGQDIMSLV